MESSSATGDDIMNRLASNTGYLTSLAPGLKAFEAFDGLTVAIGWNALRTCVDVFTIKGDTRGYHRKVLNLQ